MKHLILTILLFLLLVNNTHSQSQTLVNLIGEKNFGLPGDYDWGASVLDASGNYLTTGHSKVNSGQTDLLLVKQAATSDIVWQQTFSVAPNSKCYGIALTTDALGNIYVAGASKEANGSFNYLILKYSPSGTKLWHTVLNGSGNGDDIPTGILCSGTGTHVFVTGARTGAGGQYDYWTLSLNSATGNVEWSVPYDFAGLQDAPAALGFDQFGNVVVTGVSAATSLSWELATLKYAPATGQQLAVNRVSNNGIGLYLPSSLDIDFSGNIYVTGTTATSPTQFDIKTIKINSNFSIGWQKTFDAPSNLDSATVVKVDPFGNVIVSGFYNRQSGGKESVILKYDNLGNLLWKKIRTNNPAQATSRPHCMTLDAFGNIFAAFEVVNGNESEIVLSQYNTNGDIRWEKSIAKSVGANKPLTIKIEAGGKLFVTSLRKGTLGGQYATCQIEPLSRLLNPVLVNGEASHIEKEVLVRFKSNLVNTNFVNNRGLRYGRVQDIVTDAIAITEIGNKISAADFSNWTLVKVHPNMTTADSVRFTPKGKKIYVPDFYNTFVLMVPRSYDRIRGEYPLADTLGSNDLVCYIRVTEVNKIITADVCEPDDPIYVQQGNLHPTSSFPNGSINVEQAWCIAGGGSSSIKVAIVDSGVRFTHEDYNVESSSGSVVVSGRDYGTGGDLLTNPDNDLNDHGTRVASVLGSIRNNATGVAGISGGNDNADGVRLVGLKAIDGILPIDALISAFADAVDEFQVNIINCSGGSDAFPSDKLILMREKVQHANRMGVVICASRGNTPPTSSPRIPGTIQDEWVICVGGTGTDGNYNPECRQGAPIDIAAPSRWQLTRTAQACEPGTGGPGIPCTQSDQAYGGISFTSGATPHAAGLAALMMSYYNASPGATMLTHDDIEYIMQASAKDVVQLPAMPGYDGQTGFGLMNAGAALKMIERPRCNVYHFGTDVNAHSRITEQVATNIDITLTEPYTTESGQSFDKGAYKADVWKVTATVSHPLPAGFTLDHYWPRHSTSTVFRLFTNSGGQNQIQPVENVAIVGTPTANSAVVEGYVYFLKNNDCSVMGWIPATKEDAQLTYSVIGCDPALSSSDTDIRTLKVYPNPTNEMLNFEWDERVVGKDAQLQIVDATGRTVRVVSNISADARTFQMSIIDLPQGIFTCHILVGNDRFVSRFVKM